MNTSAQSVSIADYYFGFLEDLTQNSKLDLISRLSLSLMNDHTDADNSLQSLFGAYKSDETADELIKEIRSSRVFNRDVKEL